MMKLLATTALLVVMLLPAQAQNRVKSVWTGGEKGAYQNTFCPPIPQALGHENFPGYQCSPSGGSVDNIQKVLAQPTSIGFVQLDVYAREAAQKPEITTKTTVIRQLACEGVWMITKNPNIKNFGEVTGRARRQPFVVAGGGSKATWEFMQTLDPDGLGRARNVTFAKDATEVINQVSANPDTVGMFVQFADPNNANIKLMMDKGVTVVPIASRELLRAKAGDKDVYQVQTFQLTGGYFSAKEATTTCTPVAIITGNPDQFQNKDDKDDQVDLIRAVNKLPDSQLLPKDGAIASLIKGAKRITGKALDEMTAAAEYARKRIEEQQ